VLAKYTSAFRDIFAENEISLSYVYPLPLAVNTTVRLPDRFKSPSYLNDQLTSKIRVLMSDSWSRVNFAQKISRHTVKQLKFVIPGAAVTYYFGLSDVFLRIVSGDGDNAHNFGRSAILSIWTFALPVSNREHLVY
jgi:hypothetical protein